MQATPPDVHLQLIGHFCREMACGEQVLHDYAAMLEVEGHSAAVSATKEALLQQISLYQAEKLAQVVAMRMALACDQDHHRMTMN